MSECEHFAQVAQEKWANERIAWIFWANHSFSLLHSQKMSDSLKKFKFLFFCLFFTVSKKAKVSLISSEQSEQITQVAQDKLATVSDSLRLLRRNKWSWANLSGRSPKISEWANYSLFERSTHLLTFLSINERFALKFDEEIPNPAWISRVGHPFFIKERSVLCVLLRSL